MNGHAKNWSGHEIMKSKRPRYSLGLPYPPLFPEAEDELRNLKLIYRFEDKNRVK